MEYEERIGMIKDQSEEYQRGYHDGYHSKYADHKSAQRKLRKEERDRYTDRLNNLEISAYYPFNFIAEISDDDELQVYSLKYINEVLTKYLTEREKRVVEMRFKEHRTLEEVGDKLNVTRERIRQIETHAQRKIKSHLRETKAVPEHIYDDLLKKYEQMQGKYDELKKLVNYNDLIQEEKEPAEYKIKIDDLDLSVRARNCLARAGYETVGDLVGISEEELLQIRNMGVGCVKEIAQILYDFGIEIRRFR